MFTRVLSVKESVHDEDVKLDIPQHSVQENVDGGVED